MRLRNHRRSSSDAARRTGAPSWRQIGHLWQVPGRPPSQQCSPWGLDRTASEWARAAWKSVPCTLLAVRSSALILLSMPWLASMSVCRSCSTAPVVAALMKSMTWLPAAPAAGSCSCSAAWVAAVTCAGGCIAAEAPASLPGAPPAAPASASCCCCTAGCSARATAASCSQRSSRRSSVVRRRASQKSARAAPPAPAPAAAVHWSSRLCAGGRHGRAEL